MTPTDYSWHVRGACYKTFEDAFVTPEGKEGEPKRLAREARAKAFCARCPVIEDCLAFAWATVARGTIWAGMNDEERTLEKRNRQRRKGGQAA